MLTSTVVRADSKFLGTGQFLCVDVRFRTNAQLDELIRALTELRDSEDTDTSAVIVQDGSGGRDGKEAEITFHRAEIDAPDEESLVADAKQWLTESARLIRK
ncbi:MAG: hypothetical protein CMJ58_22075 [Planctomycetaceae bacterium]|nr:hypothetical protein [Planctomycetaceae bacterium]